MPPNPFQHALIVFFLGQAFGDKLEADVRERAADRMIAGRPKLTMAQIADGSMSQRECDMWQLTLGLNSVTPQTDKEIAQIYGLAVDEVGQIKQHGLRQLQESTEVPKFTG